MRNASKVEIVKGLGNREFVLFYQPKMCLLTRQIVGAEALVRWRRRDGTLLNPGAFLAEMEKARLIPELTLQLLPQLLADINRDLGTDLRISLNVSVDDFKNTDFVEMIVDAVEKQYLPPSCLELELTETQALGADGDVADRIRFLTDLGITLSMDDFGIGYSNLDTLSQLPFTTIKLDQGIVRRVLDSRKSATIISSSIRLGHELSMEVVAEGVESSVQRDFLTEAGCTLMQGYLISPPLPIDEFQEFRANVGQGSGVPMASVHMAILDHVQWRRQMISYAIQCARLPHDSKARQSGGFPPMCPTQCGLGRWYYGEGKYFSHSPIYEAINAPHQELHRIGNDIIEKIRAGATLHDLDGSFSTMRAVSTGLIRLLEDLEDGSLRNLYFDGEQQRH